MTKKLKIYQIGFIVSTVVCIGLMLAMGIIAVQKSMKLNLGFQVNPSFECKIVYNGNTIFCNTTKNGESLVVGDGVLLNGNNLTLNQNFSGLGAEFTLTIHNYTALKTDISVSGTGANGDTLTLDAYSSGTAPNGNITIIATGTSATLTFAEWVPTISCELNNATTTILNGTKLPMSGDYTITITPTTGYLFTQFNVINISDGGYTWNNSTGVFTITDWAKVTGNITITVKAEVFRFVAYSGSGHTAPISRDGTAYKYYCEFGIYPQSYVGTNASIVSGMTETSVKYAHDNAVKFYSQNGVNKYALVGSNYYAFEPIRWVVLGVDTSGGITFNNSDISVTVVSTTATLFTTSTSNLTLEDNRIKHNGAVQNKLLFLSELALDNEYFGYYHNEDSPSYCNEWKNTNCDVRRFLNDTSGTGAEHQTTFATISGLGQYYDTSSTHVTGKYIQQTNIKTTTYVNNSTAGNDDGYYNMFLLGSNRNHRSSTKYYNWTDSYNIASYFPLYATDSAKAELKGNVTPYAVANGAYTNGGSATSNTLGASCWWLRSGNYPNSDYNDACIVLGDGNVYFSDVGRSDRAVRPSFILNLG